MKLARVGYVFCGLSVIALVLGITYYRDIKSYLSPVSAISANALSTAPDIMLKDVASFHQNDALWTADKMGQTEDTLGAYGCTVSSVANAITNLTDSAIAPNELNQKLSQAGGYTDRGWLIWNKIDETVPESIKVKTYSSPSHQNINTCLHDEGYPVVKIMLGGIVQHWVMIVGKRGSEYLIRDPIVGVSDEGPIPLTERGKRIFSVRCISKESS